MLHLPKDRLWRLDLLLFSDGRLHYRFMVLGRNTVQWQCFATGWVVALAMRLNFNSTAARGNDQAAHRHPAC